VPPNFHHERKPSGIAVVTDIVSNATQCQQRRRAAADFPRILELPQSTIYLHQANLRTLQLRPPRRAKRSLPMGNWPRTRDGPATGPAGRRDLRYKRRREKKRGLC